MVVLVGHPGPHHLARVGQAVRLRVIARHHGAGEVTGVAAQAGPAQSGPTGSQPLLFLTIPAQPAKDHQIFTGYTGCGISGRIRPSTKMPCQTMNTSSVQILRE